MKEGLTIVRTSCGKVGRGAIHALGHDIAPGTLSEVDQNQRENFELRSR